MHSGGGGGESIEGYDDGRRDAMKQNTMWTDKAGKMAVCVYVIKSPLEWTKKGPVRFNPTFTKSATLFPILILCWDIYPTTLPPA